MHWMWDAMWARVGWALGELMTAVLVILAAIAFFMMYALYRAIKEYKCGHEEMRQMPSSTAMECRHCGLVKWPEKGERQREVGHG